ncbi:MULTISPECIES: hypothetical protein [unclassified Kitasatospora]|uniref:hypothetical protein n=1 Tax=unclassified Kitasatospora TaxID=2633591 RepID=UPI0034364E19
MSEGAYSWVNDSQGPLHSGSGPQYNFWHTTATSDRLVRTGTNPLVIAHQHRLRLSRWFVPPDRYGTAVERLATPGSVVLLDGPEGSGRRAAATMLLHQLDLPAGRFEELSVEREESGLDIAPDDRFLLDLSSTPDDAYLGAQRVLTSYRAVVEQNAARMVVVLPAGLGYLLDAEFAPLVVHVGRPHGPAVLSRYLRVGGIDFVPEHLSVPELKHLLHESPMRELARFAEMVCRARDSGAYGSDFSAWRDEAVAVVTNWTGEVARQVSAHRTVKERALLLTAAMLNGATADAVFHSAASLLAELRHNGDETPRLAQADLGEQLTSLHIRRDHDGRVRFERLAYDGAVRNHFWVNFPDLRQNLRDWVGRSVALPELTGDDRTNLVVRFAEQSLAAGRPGDLSTLAELWTRSGTSRRWNAEAAALLEQGLNHERYGARIRSKIYDWAVGPRLSPDLLRVLTGLCRHVIGASHPDQAVVRLHHLALRSGGEEIDVARAELLELARADRRLYEQLIDRLLARSGTSPTPNLTLLLALLKPAGILFPPPWQALRASWQAVLALPTDSWAPTAHQWLTAADGARGWRNALDVVLQAAEGRQSVLNHLYLITRDWAVAETSAPNGSSDSRKATAYRFWQKIDFAQGIETLDSRPGVPEREPR